jgi:hypothetical protein
MLHFLISLNLIKLSYSALKTLAQTVHDGFLALALDYPAPVPTMLIFQGHIDDLDAAITAWGPVNARGSHNQHLALIAAANVVREDLRQLAAYATNKKPNDKDSWSNLGFPVKRPKSPPSSLQMVRDLHVFISRLLGPGFIKLKWKRPLDSERASIKVYLVQFNNTAVQPAMTGSQGIVNGILVSGSTIIIEPPYVGANFFWVTPFNAAGYGVSSDPLYYNAAAPPAP